MSAPTTPTTRTRPRLHTLLAGLLGCLAVVMVFAAFPRGAEATSLPMYRVHFTRFDVYNDMDGGPLGCGEFKYQRMLVAMPVQPSNGIEHNFCDGEVKEYFMGDAQDSGWFPMVSNEIMVGYYFQEDDVFQVDEGGAKKFVSIPQNATKVPFMLYVNEYHAEVQNAWDADPHVGNLYGWIEIKR